MRRLLLLALLLLVPTLARATTAEPTKLAVLYFENSGNPDLQPLRLGLAQMLITDLSGTGNYDVVERSRINELLGELELQKTAAVDQSTAVNMGKLVGAHYLVMGSYFEMMGTLRLDARVVEVETGRVVSVGTSGPAKQLFALEKDLAGSIEGAIATAEEKRVAAGGAARPAKVESPKQAPAKEAPPKAEEPATQESGAEEGPQDPGATRSAPAAEPQLAEGDPDRPSDPLGAAMAFSEGLDLLDRKDLSRARQQFQRALELDPSLDDARAELAALAI